MINESNLIPVSQAAADTRAIKIGKYVFPLTVHNTGTGDGGSGMEFYKCKNTYGPYDAKTVIISGCPTAEINGTYLPTEFTTEDWNGTKNPVYKHATANYYYFYEPNNWMTWGVGADYTSDSLIYRGTAGSSYPWEDSDWNTVDGMTGVYGETTLDTDVPKTWDGYKAVLSGGVYSFEDTLTEGLTYSSNRPQELGVYNADASIKADWLIKDYPTDGLIFFAPLTEHLDNAEVGEMTVKTDLIVLENGMAKFLSTNHDDIIASNRLPFGYTNPEITLFYQFMVTQDSLDGDRRNLPGMGSNPYADIHGSTLKFFNSMDRLMTILPNTLYTMMMICESGKWRVFVNRELKFKDVSYGVFSYDRTWFKVGIFDGYLKNVLVYNRALSESEIGQLYAKFGEATDPPEIIVETPVTLTAYLNNEISEQLSVTVKPDTGETPTFSSSDMPAGLSISSEGLITGTPTAAGSVTSTVTVSYPGAESVQITLNWEIKEAGETPDTPSDKEYVYTVSGAGFTDVNGAYYDSGLTSLDRTVYTNGTVFLAFSPATLKWTFVTDPTFASTTIKLYYTQAEPHEDPTNTAYAPIDGASPAPTVAAYTGS